MVKPNESIKKMNSTSGSSSINGQDDWFEWISLAEFAYNNRVHASTQTTPFPLDNGQHPQLGVEPIRETRLEALGEFTTRMPQATQEAQSALSKAADDMACFYDLHHQKPQSIRSVTRFGSMYKTLQLLAQ